MTVDWTIIVVHALAALPPTILALAAWRQSRKTHNAVNGRMSELLDAARIAAVLEAHQALRKDQ